MWIFKTEQFLKDVASHGIHEFVDGRASRIGSAQTRAQACRIAKPYSGYLVTRHKNLRLIGSVVRIADREVFVWYQILKRGDSEYKAFSEYSKKIDKQFVTKEVLAKWFKEMSETELEKNQPESLPANISPWLDPIQSIFASVDSDDIIIYETQKWANAMERLEQFRWREILDGVQRLETICSSDDFDPFYIPTTNGLRICAQQVEDKAIFLIDVVRVATDGEPDLLVVGLGEKPLQSARRAYPIWLLADEETWFDIQKGSAYNLALSPEEQSLLKRVSGQPESELPMFINGQAGSGKSTMLAYIFAGMCKMQRDKGAGGKPVFITYNSALLEKARHTTRKILDADFNSSKPYSDIQIDDLFVNWRDYLLSLLPLDQKNRFLKENRIDYHDFVLAWEGRKGKLPIFKSGTHSHSSETVWYVIRSLIKGSETNGELDPEDYLVELTRDEKTVSSETYSEIFNRYYQSWYMPALRDSELWDDQDLTQSALNEINENSPSEPIVALVIDEAQDFTRRELRLITRTTIYSDYAIPPKGVGTRPPIVFAGDPLQTLSPTGFRWSAVKAGIYEELQGLFGPEARQPVFVELLNNYRSAEPIVRLANSIQLWRSLLFDLPDIGPQGAWNNSLDVGSPEKYVLEEIDENQFIRFAADTVLIVPCEEGGEVRFVNNDPILSKMFPDATEKMPPATVFSASSIKGLEFEKIVLFKFGEFAKNVEWDSPVSSAERDLQAEYFFNKLYVAVTRATHYLYVADSLEGDAALWDRLNQNAIEQIHERDTRRRNSRFKFTDLGVVETASTDLEGVQEKNPRENAIRTRDYARDTRSSRKMRQAASFFRRANERREADECEAWALKFEGDLKNAGKKFADANKTADAWHCFWDCMSWSDLGLLAAKSRDLPHLEEAAVRYILTESKNFEDLHLFSLAITNGSGDFKLQGESWNFVFTKYCEDAKQFSEGQDHSKVLSVATSLVVIYDSGYLSVATTAATLFAQAGDKRGALRILEGMPSSNDPERARLLFSIHGSPSGLNYLLDAGLYDDVRKIWFEADRPYADDWIKFVLPALRGRDYITDRLEILLNTDDVKSAAEAFVNHDNWGATYVDYALRIVKSFGQLGFSLDAIEFADSVVEMRLGRLPKITLQITLINELSKFLMGNNWQLGSLDQSVKFKECVNKLYDSVRFEKLNFNDVPGFGALLEVAGYYRWARTLYIRFAESKDIQLRNYCRRRYIFVTTEYLKELQRDRSTKSQNQRKELQDDRERYATDWGIEAEQNSHKRMASLLNDKVDLEAVRSSGKFGPVAWIYRTAEHRLDLDIDDDVLLATVKLPLDGGEPRSVGAEVSKTDQGIVVSAGERIKVFVEIDNDIHLSVSENSHEIGRCLVFKSAKNHDGAMENSQSTVVQQRATRNRSGPVTPRKKSPKTINMNSGLNGVQLAKQLNVTFEGLWEIVDELGFHKRKIGERFSLEESEAIREFKSRFG